MSAENTRTIESNTFYVDVKVFLEGVQVPHINASVSYGTGEPPTCTITIPAHNFLRQLPSTTKVLIVHRDLVPDTNGQYKWRVLFDGELSSINYSISAEGAYMTISAIHTTAYLTLMQLISLPASEAIFQKEVQALGETVFVNLAGATKVMVDIVTKVMDGKNYESMADLIYLMLKNILEGYKDKAATGKWYWEKLGNDFKGYKIMDRIYGVSDKARQSQLVETKIQGSSSTDTPQTGQTTTNGEYSTTVVKSNVPSNGSANYGSTSITIYQVTGDVGIGGTTRFGAVMLDQMQVFIDVGTKYVWGGSGYEETDCGQSVKDALTKALSVNSLPDFPRYVPDQIIWAKQNGYWHEGSGANNAKAGDAIVVKGDGHVVISDGNGGYYGMSSSEKRMTKNPSVVNAFDHQVTGYIDLNKYYNDIRGTR